MNPPTFRRADEFNPGVRISVVGIPALSNLYLEALTHSAAHVVKDGAHTTISCGTPCVLCEDVEEIAEVITETEDETSDGMAHTGKRGRPQGLQGKLIADKLTAFVFPTVPFTIRQLVELTGVDQLHLISFINKNCVCVGDAEKIPGQRGRVAKLYLKK